MIWAVSDYWRVFCYDETGNERTSIVWPYVIGLVNPSLNMVSLKQTKEKWAEIHNLKNGKNREYFDEIISKNIERYGSVLKNWILKI